MPSLKAHILDAEDLKPLAAKVNLSRKNGSTIAPPENIQKVGYGKSFFYADSEFQVDVTPGQLKVTVERGTEYIPLRKMLIVPDTGTLSVDLKIRRWINLARLGWYSGNTHVHYRETETRPDDRLHLDPQVEDLKVLIVSILQRWDIPYSSNKYPVGLSHNFSKEDYMIDVGEECRHNLEDKIGYGHVLFANINHLVEPVSRGRLVNKDDPDYPPLCDACDEAHAQGGMVIWCHDGVGMEFPVAAALSKLDALNLFDPVSSEPGYDYWYRLLNCGFKIPVSSGTDWFICDSNRVYVFLRGRFSYNTWLDGLKDGRTFITNAPALFLSANGSMVGDTIKLKKRSVLDAKVEAKSCIPMDYLEIVKNGETVHSERLGKGAQEVEFSIPIRVNESCWIAARCSGASQTSSSHPIFAHTSPIYVNVNDKRICRKEDARFYINHINESIGWVNERGKFKDESQKQHVISLLKSARSVYEDLNKL